LAGNATLSKAIFKQKKATSEDAAFLNIMKIDYLAAGAASFLAGIAASAANTTAVKDIATSVATIAERNHGL